MSSGKAVGSWQSVVGSQKITALHGEFKEV